MKQLPLLTGLILGVLLAAQPALAAQSPSPTKEITMLDSVRATLDSHRSLRAIQENRIAVEHEKDRAVRGYGPRVDVTAGTGGSVLNDVTTRRSDEEGTFNTLNRAGATLTQPIWDGFATRSRVRVAESTLESMNYRVFDNATSLALDTIIAHIDVLRLRKLLDLAEENVSEHKRLLGLARNRAQEGADTLADVSKAESRLARAQTSLVEAQAALLSGQDTYTRLTTLYGYARLSPVPAATLPYKDMDAVLEEAKTANPKLEAYLQDINAATGQRQLTQSAYYPSVNLEAGPNYMQRGDKEMTYTYSFDVMGVLRWNVFNSGADVAADQAEAARVRQARQVMYSFYDDLRLDIQKTWITLQAAHEQYKYWTQSESLNIITRDAYQEQFLMGQRSLLDLLDAQNELYNSAVQRVTARNNILIGDYRLQALSGVLLSRLDIPRESLRVEPAPAQVNPRERYQ